MTLENRLSTVIMKRTMHEKSVYFRPTRKPIKLMRWLALESASV
ncbi:MAG: hypothetical protein ABI947_24230 [Chloroflexota bacterium]